MKYFAKRQNSAERPQTCPPYFWRARPASRSLSRGARAVWQFLSAWGWLTFSISWIYLQKWPRSTAKNFLWVCYVW